MKNAKAYIKAFRAAGGTISVSLDGAVQHGWGDSGADKVHRAHMLANPGDDFDQRIRQALEAETV